jgi:ankyrin repeat protein
MSPFSISKSRIAALIVFVLLAFWALKFAGNAAVQTVPDSASYLEFRFLPVRSALSNIRTLGYPALVQAVRIFSPDLRALPAVQAVLLAVCVGVFWIGLQCYGFSPWSALAAAAPLLLVKHFQWLTPYVMSEAASGALCIATIGLTLMAISRPRKVAIWVALAIVLFLTYQVRPAYLFLVALVPLMGVLLLLIRGAQRRWRGMLRQAVLLLAVSVGPFLGFSALRWATVGHFGLVSFGGTDAIGIALEMLDLPTIERLPPHLRPTALAIRRERLHWVKWEGEVLTPATLLYLGFPTYALNVFSVAHPISQKFYGREQVELNRQLSEMTRAIIAARSGWYFDWLRLSWSEGFRQALATSFSESGLDIRLALLFLLFYLGTRVVTRWRRVDPELRLALRERAQAEASALAIIALGLFATQMLLTVLVVEPEDRYVSAAAIFLPSLAYLIVFGQAREFCLLLAGREPWRLDVKDGFGSAEEAKTPAAPAEKVGITARRILTPNRVLLAIAILAGLGILALVMAPPRDNFLNVPLDNPQALERALEQQPGLATAADSHQVTLLHLAALHDEPEAIRLLIRHGARVDASDALGLTPLHWAAVRGAARAAAALLQAGADASRPSRTGIQPIHLAADLATLRLLLNAGANPNALDGAGGTPLRWATDLEAVRALLLAGADPNAQHVDDETPDGALTPLHVAINRGDLLEAEALIVGGANPNAPNAEGLPPLAQVIQAPPFAVNNTAEKQASFVRLLLKYGADPNRTVPLRGPGGKMVLSETATARSQQLGMKPSEEITMLSMAAADGEEEVIPVLLAAHSDINRRSGGGMTALHWAALAGQSHVVYQLLRNGAAPDIRDDAGRTALDIARGLRQELVMRQLSGPAEN